MSRTEAFRRHASSRWAFLTRTLSYSAWCAVLLHLMVLPSQPAEQEDGVAAARPWSSSAVQLKVDDFRTRLAIESPVKVSVVPTNIRIVSVTPPRPADPAFELSIEGAFLDLLSDDDLSAVIAHELGHVWVATHHPYLQTERLANSIAMRVVSRDSLERVYAKVWARGDKGDLAKFLGPQLAASK
jgi:Zn-dependent protease with chaperone function